MRGGVAVITLNRPEKKNPLTFESYAELGAPFGFFGRRVDRLADLPGAIEEAQTAVEGGRTAILNVVLDDGVMAR